MDRLAIEIMEDISIPGRVFFQLLSGMEYGHFSVQTLGSFCFCKGRFVLQHKWLPSRRIYLPYQCTLDCAENVVVKDVTSTETASFVPDYLKTKRIFSIKANNFPSILPLELVSVDLVLASYKERKDLVHHHRKEKFVFLFRAQVQFKAYEQISLSNGYSSSFYTIKDILFDKMTLFSASVTLPRSQPFKPLQSTPTGSVGIASEQSPPTKSRDRLPRTPKLQKVNVQSLSEKLQVIFLEGNIAMDIFLYLMILIIWLICHGEDLSLRQTILFMVIMAILLINSRTVAAFLLKKSFTSVDKGSVDASNGRSFFVNGWNAWSFCGSVRQGETPPVYTMPSVFVKAFHHGGVGTSLPINLGEGDIPISPSYFTKNGRTFHQGKVITPNFTTKEIKTNRDHIASDMFTLLADLQSQFGLVVGFLSQRQHFGCISTNRNYDRISIHISGDGVLIPSQGSFTTDVLAIYAVSSLDDPFSIYTSMTSDEHQVRKKLTADIISGLSNDGNKTQSTSNHPVFSPFQAKPEIHSFQPISSIGEEDDELFSSYKNTTFTMSDQSEDIRQQTQIPVGWCSWYHFFRNINETNLSKNIELMKQYQEKYYLQSDNNNNQGKSNNLFQLFQIDDGYQLHWGDWLEITPSFSSSRSLNNIVEKIHDAGLLSGIWLAPFAADKDANIVKQHPDWILRKREIASRTSSWLIWLLTWIFYPIVYLFSSWPSNSANCGKFFYGLDITHPSFQEYVIDVFHTITRDWGIRYLKLDFLYAAVLQDAQHSYYDRTLTRAQIMQLGMKIINESLRKGISLKQKLRKRRRLIKKRLGRYGSRDLLEEDDEEEGLSLNENDDEEEDEGKYFLLGCGSALGSMIGHVHANRISPDAGLTWEAEIPFCHHDKWNLPSARTMIRNTVNRLFMHNKWWINDPDCLLLRDELPFTDEEIIGITTVKALSGGSVLISDDLAKISSRRFRLMQQLLPPTNTAAIAVDLMDKETPELFRIVFVSNHFKRTLEQQKLHRRKMREALTKGENESNKPFYPTNPDENPLQIVNPSLFSPFEAVLYSKRHPQSPLLSRKSSPMASGAKLSMVDSFDFVEAKRSFAEFQLNESQEEEDDEEKLQNESFDETLEEDHAILQSVDGKIAKGTPVTAEMRCQGIKEKWLDKRDLLKRWILFTVCNWADPVNEAESEKIEVMDRSTSVDSVSSNTSTQSAGIASAPSSSPTPKKVEKGKTQFVSLKSIFTEEILTEFIEYTTFLYDPMRKSKKLALKSNASGLNSPNRSGVFPANPYNVSKRSLSARQLLHNGSASSLVNEVAYAASPGDTFRNTTPATPRAPSLSLLGTAVQIKHILHLFNFWNQTYSYRIIDIMNGADGDVSIVNTVGGVNSNHNENNNDNNEIAFPDVPYHSAHIYSIQLSLHPLLPKYLGSNFHFSCGLEVRHCFLTETLPSSKKALEQFSEDYLKQRLQQEEDERKELEEFERFELASESQHQRKGSSRHGTSSVASSSVPSSRGGSFTGISVNTSFTRGLFSPKTRGRYRNRRNLKTSPHPTLASAFSGSISYNSFSPVVQTMCIAFEDGILKDDAWDGFIWLYLPVNIKRAKIFYQLLGKVEISGTAWGGNDSNLSSTSEERIKVVDYIEETSCRAAGYIYRIKVVASKFNQQAKQSEQKKLEEDVRHLTKSRRTRSGYISATSTIDEEDSIEDSGSRDDASNSKKSKEDQMKEIDALAKRVDSEDDKDGDESLSNGSFHPSLSMSATFENIGFSGLVPKPLKTRFDSSDPGIFLSRSASFMIMNKSHGTFNLQEAEGVKANYSSPSKPLKISNVVNLQKGSEDLDYLMVSWISDMEESVVRVDSPTALFS